MGATRHSPPPAGSSVLKVVATDEDEGENAAITFSIVSGDINIFSLNCEYHSLVPADWYLNLHLPQLRLV